MILYCIMTELCHSKKPSNPYCIFCHENHQEVVLMKKIAREHVYWPGLDKEIRSWVSRMPSMSNVEYSSKKKVSIFLEPCENPMQRVHFFYAIYKCLFNGTGGTFKNIRSIFRSPPFIHPFLYESILGKQQMSTHSPGPFNATSKIVSGASLP